MREFLREDELATFKTTAWKESRRWENETILEPNVWQERQNELSPSSVDLPEKEKIAHRMGTLQLEFPKLCRTGLIAAAPHEIIGVSLGENHVDFIYLGIFPRSLDRAIEDWTRGHVGIAMLQNKEWMKEKAEEIRTLGRKYIGLSSATYLSSLPLIFPSVFVLLAMHPCSYSSSKRNS